MKILFLFLLFWGTLLHAQNENVVIDGVIFSADRKTLISYPRDKVGEAYVVPDGTEIIGDRSFLGAIHLKTLNLPLSLKVIEDWAMSSASLVSIIWHTYPEVMGRNVFAYSKVMAFNTSENSDNCVSIDGVLFSKDKKTLLLFPREKVGWCKYEVPDGTEVVATGAFEDGQIDELILPSSLVRIEDYAFWMTKRIITRNIFGCVPRVSCQALIPPVIVGNPFMSPEDIFLSVPKESFDIYCNSSYWKSFYSINGVMGVGVQSLEIVPSSNVWIQNHLLFLESEKEIEKVKIYTIHGICIHNESVNDRKWQVSTAELPTELLLIEVVTADGDKDVFKLTQ